MKVHAKTILHFEKAVPDKILKKLDIYLQDEPVHDMYETFDLSSDDIILINQVLRDRVNDDVYNYYLGENRFQHIAINENLNDLVWVKGKSGNKWEFKNKFIEWNPINVKYAWASQYHRANTTYNGSTCKWMTNENSKFYVIICLSDSDFTFSKLYFPIQGASVNMDRGDILLVPTGIHHPISLGNVDRGILKLVECI